MTKGREASLEEMLAAFQAPEPDGYCQTDWQQDIEDSLQLFLHALTQISVKPSYSIKWSIIGAHSAATSALAAHLSGTGNWGALTKQSYKHHKDAYEKNTEPSDSGRVASFRDLLARATGEADMIDSAGSVIRIGDDSILAKSDIEDLELLSTLRDKFTHFRAIGWAIEEKHVHRLNEIALRLIQAVIEDDWAFRIHFDERERVEQLLGTCQLKLAELMKS